jgi:branched-chain amino acid transport system ATP-binding protein
MSTPLFRVQGLCKRFNGLVATDHVDLGVLPGEVHALIGPNGAGKSTFVNLVSGLLPADAGVIELAGRRLDALPAHRRVDAGLARCFQVTSIYPALTVRDNLMLAAQSKTRGPLRPWGSRRHVAALAERTERMAERTGITPHLQRIAGTLSHGAQRQLDVALALLLEPRLLLLDEPMAGMGPEESEQMATLIDSLRGHLGILLIEHDMQAIFRLADRISVLVYGRLLATGTVDEIRRHREVQAVYLGSEAS